uniref:60S ribosomal protein L5-2 n=1 Tax=Stygiella incarcerata TaxID=1712417 RepID=A0A192ZI48_9EUKA|nr:60S ribosomal protein L5-2 [Stygiella incarcerata]
MGFVKVVKNKAYFMRFQVKFRRRREGKTDYYARKRLIMQDKTKFAAPKYRLVVRIANKNVTVQVAKALIDHDEVLASAYSHELPRYGVKVGLTNYAACYATGLLLARRLLKKFGLDDKYTGVEEVDGSHFEVEEMEDGPRPFRANLDIGVARSTTGARVFAVMKGACDGGLFVPHSDSRFPGYDREEKKLDSSVLRKYIFGGHVADYMRLLEEEDPEKYQKQFAHYIKEGVTADSLEEMYASAHTAIRENPEFVKKESSYDGKKKRFTSRKLNLAARRNRVKQMKEMIMKRAEEALADE